MFSLVGKLYYRAHPATPIVLGDFAAMKRWRGAPDGEVEGEISLGDETAVGFASMDLASPYVYASETGAVLLVPPTSYGRKVDPPSGEALDRLLTAASDEVFEQYELIVSSGAVALTIAYNATPEEGADTSDLDELCFHDAVPRLPAQRPSAPLYLRELVVLPLRNGAYAFECGRVGGFERFRLARAEP